MSMTVQDCLMGTHADTAAPASVLAPGPTRPHPWTPHTHHATTHHRPSPAPPYTHHTTHLVGEVGAVRGGEQRPQLAFRQLAQQLALQVLAGAQVAHEGAAAACHTGRGDEGPGWQGAPAAGEAAGDTRGSGCTGSGQDPRAAVA